jgi:hypothetical protein
VLQEPALLDPQPPTDCKFKTDDPRANERQRIDYERQCYRHAEMLVRARLQPLEDAIARQTVALSRRRPTAARLMPSALRSPDLEETQRQVTTRDGSSWQVFVESRFGTSMALPIELLSRTEGQPRRGTGKVFTTADRQAAVAVYSQENFSSRASPDRYVAENFKVPPGILDYKRVAATFFAISAVHDGQVFYSRCNFSNQSGGAIHCFDLKYPERDKRMWDAIVTRMSLSLRPLVRG